MKSQAMRADCGERTAAPASSGAIARSPRSCRLSDSMPQAVSRITPDRSDTCWSASDVLRLKRDELAGVGAIRSARRLAQRFQLSQQTERKCHESELR